MRNNKIAGRPSPIRHTDRNKTLFGQIHRRAIVEATTYKHKKGKLHTLTFDTAEKAKKK